MKKYNGNFAIAVHPGEILLEMLEEYAVSQAQLARHVKMDPSICKGRRGISAEMAVIFGKVFGISAATWMNLQKNWEWSQVKVSLAEQFEPLKLRA